MLAYKNVFPDVPELAGSQPAVVGTVNNTTLTIIPASDVGLHAAGVPFNVTLMQGQTYQLRQTNACMMTSAEHSSPPTSRSRFWQPSVREHSKHERVLLRSPVEQLWPTDRWGTNFVSVTFSTRFGATPSDAPALLTNTIVRDQRRGVARPVESGEFAEVRFAANAHITADKPIQNWLNTRTVRTSIWFRIPILQ